MSKSEKVIEIRPVTKEDFKLYAELKAEEKRIKAAIDELNPSLRAHIESSGGDKLVIKEIGSYTISKRGTWKYSPAVEALQEDEKAKGIAKKVESISLIFKAEGSEE